MWIVEIKYCFEAKKKKWEEWTRNCGVYLGSYLKRSFLVRVVVGGKQNQHENAKSIRFEVDLSAFGIKPHQAVICIHLFAGAIALHMQTY